MPVPDPNASTPAPGDALNGDAYRELFLTAGIGLASVQPGGRLLEFNARFADITGRPREPLKGLFLQDLAHPDELAADQAQFEACLDGRQDRFSRETRVLRPDGTVVYTNLQAVLLRDPQGQPRHFVLVLEDIGERLRVRDVLGSAQAAERASRAKTEFLSRMSHELRTPLNAMLGFAQLLRVDPREPLSETQRQKVQHIERAGAHLLAMMTDVLDLSRIEAGSLPMSIEVLAVNRVMDEAASLVSNQASQAGLRLQHTLPDPVLYVRADMVRLRQVLVNLLSNAIKYNVPGGQVQLDALPIDGHVVLSVRDTGPGLRPEQLAHLFEPFNRLGAERSHIEGTGIGLVIVQRLVDLMQGRVEVSSTPGNGSTFRVWLPAAPAPRSGEGPDTGQRSNFGQLDDLSAGSRTILYAEDNAINVELLRQVMFMRPRWHLEVAQSGHQAIAMAQSNPPDLLLLDMHLGDMSGLDVSDALARFPSTATIPRVALSADAMPDQINEARERGFVDYLTKPLDVKRFLRLLDQCDNAEEGQGQA